MKKIHFLIILFAAACALTACEKDGEKLIVTAPGAPTGLSSDATQIVLRPEHADDLALTLYWNQGAAPTVSNPQVSLPDELTALTLLIAADAQFSAPYRQSVEKGRTSLQFTGEALNNIMLRLGFDNEELHEVHMKLLTEMGDTSASSDALVLRIAPYIGDMTAMQMQTTDFSSTFATLHSTEARPNRYEGFAVTSAGWQNFYFVAADGTVWGNDGDAGTPFMLSSSDSKWNCWFAGTTGCHYVYMDTDMKEWWQVHLPAIEIVCGEQRATMRFSSATGAWTGVITTTQDNAALSVGGSGALYDIEVGTEGSAVPKEYPFTIAAAADGGFRFTQGSANSNITAAAAGTYTLTLDVAQQTLLLEAGGSDTPPVEYPEALYAYYYYKEASERLDLATEMAATAAEGAYEGFIYTDPDWGDRNSNFRFLTATDDTATVYATNTSQYELSSEASVWNLWSSNTGLNYVVADLASMSWSETKVAQIAVSGDFNGWSTSTDVMQYDPATGRWTATCDISTIGYGFKFVLGDEANAWRWQYGDPDGDGVLQVAGNADNVVPATTGTYRIELHLSSYATPVYTLTLQ